MDANNTPKQLIRLADVPKLQWLPKRRGGSKLNIATPFRWAQHGSRGHKLRVVRVGGARQGKAR
jgi:hypothetical protein